MSVIFMKRTSVFRTAMLLSKSGLLPIVSPWTNPAGTSSGLTACSARVTADLTAGFWVSPPHEQE